MILILAITAALLIARSRKGRAATTSGDEKKPPTVAPPTVPPPTVPPRTVPPPTVPPLSQREITLRAAKSKKVPLSLRDEEDSQKVIVSAERPTSSSPPGMYMVLSAGELAGMGAVLTLLAFALSTGRPAILSAEEAAAVAAAPARENSAEAWVFIVDSGGRRVFHTFVNPMSVATLQEFALILAT